MPEINQPLFQQILDQIKTAPASHDQADWEDVDYYADNECGTTRCVGGWAIYFALKERGLLDSRGIWSKGRTQLADELNTDGTYSSATIAQNLLGITDDEAAQLFYEYSDEQAVELVEKYALKGRGE